MTADAAATKPPDAVADALVRAAALLAARDLSWGASGNISARLSARTILISASGVPFRELTEARLVRCDLASRKRSGSGRPSVETGMHAGIYRIRPDVGAVVHASPFFATLAAASSLDVDASLLTDTAYYLRRVQRVPYAPPGSTELAEIAARGAAECNVLLLDNHGALTLGRDPLEAVTRMEALEMLCRMLVYGRLGVPLRPLGDGQVRDLLVALGTYGVREKGDEHS